jgi:hypothetical protein
MSIVVFLFFVGGDVAWQFTLSLLTTIADITLSRFASGRGYVSMPVKSLSKSLAGPWLSSGRLNGPRRPMPRPTPLGSAAFLKTGLSVSVPLSGELGNSWDLSCSLLAMGPHEEYMATKGSPLVRSSEVPRLEVDDMRETSESQLSADSDRLWLVSEVELQRRGDSANRCRAFMEDIRTPRGVGGWSLRNKARGDGPDCFAILSGVSISHMFRFLPKTREVGAGDDCVGLALRRGSPFIMGLFASRISMLNESSRARECSGWLGLGKRHG